LYEENKQLCTRKASTFLLEKQVNSDWINARGHAHAIKKIEIEIPGISGA
jgi:hypothetical protein